MERFNYGNSRFIAVDTEEIPTSLTPRSPGEVVAKKLKLDPGFVSPKQIELLSADLEANKHKAHVFLFMHHPIKPAKKGSRLNKENADDLEALFAKYLNVSYVIAAHEHLYYNATGTTLKPAARKNPSSGGPTKSSKNCSASYHYLVFEENGNQVEVKVVMLPVATKRK